MPRPHILAASQLDRKLASLRRAAQTLGRATPTSGWIKALREGLGMSSAAFGKRLNVRQQSAAEFEVNERAGTITLASLRRAADALDADLVYAIVPRRKLHETISARALELAQERIAPITNSMRLEAQGLSRAETAEQIEELARELRDRPRELWR
jgi:predicted DNA-binding mobile mystery protein A